MGLRVRVMRTTAWSDPGVVLLNRDGVRVRVRVTIRVMVMVMVKVSVEC